LENIDKLKILLYLEIVMGQFYLDIETTGLDPLKDKILTMQYQELDRNTGEAKGELVILKE